MEKKNDSSLTTYKRFSFRLTCCRFRRLLTEVVLMNVDYEQLKKFHLPLTNINHSNFN